MRGLAFILTTLLVLNIEDAFAAKPMSDCQPLLDQIGLPEKEGDQTILIQHDWYWLNYNKQTHQADWVLECLDEEDFDGDASQKHSPDFGPDEKLEALGIKTIIHADYTYSGYDRGHMAPAADFAAKQSNLDKTFRTSNMSPQTGVGFNRHIWADLEAHARDQASIEQNDMSMVVVITGPIMSAPDLHTPPHENLCEAVAARNKTFKGETCVPIPAAFYKIIYRPDTKKTRSFVLPNKKLSGEDYLDYIRSNSEVENRTGYDFFPELDKKKEQDGPHWEGW